MPDPAPAELERLACETARTVAAATARRPDRGQDLLAELLGEATPDAGTAGAGGRTGRPGRALQWIASPVGERASSGALSLAAALDGEVVASAVVDPASGELFSACLGGGARRDGRALAVSRAERLGDALVSTGDAGRGPQPGRTAAVLGRGSRGAPTDAALALSWVACGRLDGYFAHDVDVWEHAAGALIAAEAGALVQLPCPENDELVVAAGPQLFDALRTAVEPAAHPTAS